MLGPLSKKENLHKRTISGISVNDQDCNLGDEDRGEGPEEQYVVLADAFEKEFLDSSVFLNPMAG